MAASRYRIVLRGRLSERFESAFDGMSLEHGPNRTVLTGHVRDQAQLYGLLGRLQEFGIELLAVESADASEGDSEPGVGPAASGLHVRRHARHAPVHVRGGRTRGEVIVMNTARRARRSQHSATSRTPGKTRGQRGH